MRVIAIELNEDGDIYILFRFSKYDHICKKNGIEFGRCVLGIANRVNGINKVFTDEDVINRLHQYRPCINEDGVWTIAGMDVTEEYLYKTSELVWSGDINPDNEDRLANFAGFFIVGRFSHCGLMSIDYEPYIEGVEPYVHCISHREWNVCISLRTERIIRGVFYTKDGMRKLYEAMDFKDSLEIGRYLWDMIKGRDDFKNEYAKNLKTYRKRVLELNKGLRFSRKDKKRYVY